MLQRGYEKRVLALPRIAAVMLLVLGNSLKIVRRSANVGICRSRWRPKLNVRHLSGRYRWSLSSGRDDGVRYDNVMTTLSACFSKRRSFSTPWGIPNVDV